MIVFSLYIPNPKSMALIEFGVSIYPIGNGSRVIPEMDDESIDPLVSPATYPNSGLIQTLACCCC